MTRVASLFAVFALVACGTDPSASDEEASKRKKTCTSNADCTSLQFCDTESARSCGAKGYCASRGVTLFCVQSKTPVCGCDGKPYGSACLAHKAGVSVDASAVKAQPIDGDTLAEQPWSDPSLTYTYAFTGNGTANNTDGTFTLTIEPACRRTPPYCAIATRELTGHFYTYDNTVELDYDDGSVAYFYATSDCTNVITLAGDDQGQSLTLTVSH